MCRLRDDRFCARYIRTRSRSETKTLRQTIFIILLSDVTPVDFILLLQPACVRNISRYVVMTCESFCRAVLATTCVRGRGLKILKCIPRPCHKRYCYYSSEAQPSDETRSCTTTKSSVFTTVRETFHRLYCDCKT